MDRPKVGKPPDKFWEKADKVISNEGQGPRWKCKFCKRIFPGGASRIKLHLGNVEGKGIKVCKEVDEDTMKEAREALEAWESNRKSPKRRRLGARTNSAQVNPQSVGQSNPTAPPQGSLYAIQTTGLPWQFALGYPDDSSNLSMSLGESSLIVLQDIWDETEVEGPSNAQGDINNQNNISCPGFETREADRLGLHQHDTLPPPHMRPVLEDQRSSMVHDLQDENANAPSCDIQSLQSDGTVRLPVNARQSLAEATLNVPPQGTTEANISEDNPVQDKLDDNIMLEQLNHFKPTQTDPDPNNEANEDIDSSMRNSVAREITQLEMLAPKLVGRERVVDELWDYLMTNDILCIGVYGMGGVGKTTTMKHLYNKLHDSAAFENVFWVTVSKDCSIHELQNKIARALMVPDLFKDVDEGMRPTLLFNHLSKKKKCLVILDDMWRHFELADVGIPVKKDGVRLVLTTRYRDVCEKMLCQAKIGVRPLSDEAAWALFVETFGSDLPPSQKLVAEDIVKECKGLPLAIVVRAGSMRGEVEDHVWEATLENLKRPGVLEQSTKESVFPSLMHSYNCLDKKKRLCFLTCALYPENCSIDRQELIELCIDEGVIREDRRRKMYNEGHRLLDELEKACLLEAFSEGGRGVGMHDVIRDMALHIMNTENAPCMVKSGLGLEAVPDDEEWLPNLQKVSLMRNHIMAVPPSISPNCPQLATLLLSHCSRLRKISKRFFERMQGLKVIYLSHTRITKVPKSVMNLKKLNALVLNRCSQLSRIPSLAKLTLLRKLDLRGCINIKEVPNGLEMLVNLTYLSLRETRIQRIPDGVVCKLKKLQHLEADYIAVKGEEVGKLRKLEALRCRFENMNELNEYTLCATTIESCSLVIGARTDLDYWHGVFVYFDVYLNFFNSGRVIIMDEGEYKIGETWHLPRDVKALWIRGYGGTWNMSNFMGLEELEELRITGCDEVSALSGSGGQPEEPEGQLEERTSPPPRGDHCPNLKVLQIFGCPKLKHLLVPRHSCNLYLKKLENLEIYHCEELESIIDEEELRTSSTSPLPPDAFSHFQSIKIDNCPKMKSVLTLELFMPLPSLQTIHVDNCKEMKVIGGQELDHGATSSLFLSPISTSPGDQLSTRKLALELYCLEELESIRGAATDEEESLTSSTSPLPPDAFSQLQSIQIEICPKMKYMVGRKSLPVLREIKLYGCHKMKRVLTLELFMLLPNLQTIIVHNCKEMKEVIGGQELDHGATSSLFLSPIPAASPGDQLSTRNLSLNLSLLPELESICGGTRLRDLIHVIQK
ncbi:hypothetical protein CDL15_Pgr005524 [Punica granatum]|uniref:BED-type domain-containing protein n=1 Tax=Punica granatum TaxID=22663 RepID=A0A218WW22_PUNGR|nr:hypothetical protein CDL15_Pgr005524 [Punica granatum]